MGFPRSSRALEGDGSWRFVAWLVVVVLLLGGWTAWLLAARIPVVAVTSAGRLETERAPYPIEAQVGGQIVSVPARLGQEVHVGDLLVELSSESLQFERAEERARLEAASKRVEALRRQAEALELAQRGERFATRAALQEARARAEQAEAAARQAEHDAAMLDRLGELKSAPVGDIHRTRAEAQSRRAGADAARLVMPRLEREGDVRAGEKQVTREELRGQIALLEGEVATRETVIRRLDHEIARRRITSPVAGELGELADVRVGSMVSQGDRLGVIVPSGDVRVVADFEPASALGRIRPGQHARVRLDGYPWAQWGSIRAVVARVASEPRDGHVRVELSVADDPTRRIPLRHGLPGVVEVEVERVAPLTLGLRAAGQAFQAPVPEERR